MRCPACTKEVIPFWQPLYAHTKADGTKQTGTRDFSNEITGVREPEDDVTPKGGIPMAAVAWTRCPNDDCAQLIIGATWWFYDPDAKDADEEGTRGHIERTIGRNGESGAQVEPPDSLVPQEFAERYLEAARILDASPSMASVVARGLLADLLAANGYQSERLEKQVTAFMEDSTVSERLRRLVDPIRVLGDFGAHTLRDAKGQRVIVSRADAEWTMTVLDRLFHHFIIEPARDEEALQRATELTQRVPNRRPPRAPSKGA